MELIRKIAKALHQSPDRIRFKVKKNLQDMGLWDLAQEMAMEKKVREKRATSTSSTNQN